MRSSAVITVFAAAVAAQSSGPAAAATTAAPSGSSPSETACIDATSCDIDYTDFFTEVGFNVPAATYLADQFTKTEVEDAFDGVFNAETSYADDLPGGFSIFLTGLPSYPTTEVAADAKPIFSSIITHALALQAGNTGSASMATMPSATGSSGSGSSGAAGSAGGKTSAGSSGSAGASGQANAASVTSHAGAAQPTMALGAAAGVALGLAGLAIGL